MALMNQYKKASVMGGSVLFMDGSPTNTQPIPLTNATINATTNKNKCHHR